MADRIFALSSFPLGYVTSREPKFQDREYSQQCLLRWPRLIVRLQLDSCRRRRFLLSLFMYVFIVLPFTILLQSRQPAPALPHAAAPTTTAATP
jgi:hypothetical protein